MIFDPKQVYDFELEKTADEKVLLKQIEDGTGERTEDEALKWMLPIPTVPLVPFLVLRLQDSIRRYTGGGYLRDQM